MSVVDVKVPNIGDFKDVPVIEVLVGPGDQVKADDPLITLESDKAAMEVPAPFPGRVSAVLIAIGDKVSEGSAILKLDVDGAQEPEKQSRDMEEQRRTGGPRGACTGRAFRHQCRGAVFKRTEPACTRLNSMACTPAHRYAGRLASLMSI